MKRTLCLSLLILLAACVASPGEPGQVIYLLRHAEKASGSSDPALTEPGRLRAKRVAQRLATEDIQHVFSTDYRRTRQTADPIAAAVGLSTELYDPRQADVLINQVQAQTGNVVIVGHSNTIPDLVRRLGGAAEPMSEQEYQHLYRLTVGQNVVTTLLSSD